MEISEQLRIYLEDLQVDIFTTIYHSEYDFYFLAKLYMKSKVCRNIDMLHSFWITQTPERIVEEVIKERDISIPHKNNRNINIEAVIWLASFYRRWHFITGENSNLIVRFLPVKDGVGNYFTLHQLDEENAIENVKRRYNISRNSHRHYEVNNSLDEMKEYNMKSYYYQFLSKRILKKLTKDCRLDDLEYTFNSNYYDFITFDKSIGLKSEVINDFNDLSVEEAFNALNEKAKYYKINAKKSIFFCFVFSKRYELNIEQLLTEIRSLNRSIPFNERKYDYIYFYTSGHLFEINSSGEIYSYLIPFSKKERMGVINDLKRLSLSE